MGEGIMKNIIIIGGGIAGLSAGIHAQQYGFRSVIYEQHSIVGGQCTGWDRKGYHIDGCIQWLTGTREGTELYDLWKNVVALGNVDIVRLDNFGTYEYEGTTITLWRDLDRLQKELCQLSPEDKEPIEELIKEIRLVQDLEMPARIPITMRPIGEIFKFLKKMKNAGLLMNKAGMISSEEYAKKFKHPAIRYMISAGLPEGFSIVGFIFSMATFSSGNGDIPKGGSKAMALRMKDRYEELGGKVINSVAAEEIIIKEGQAVAVRCSDGSTAKADYVVAACDAKMVLDKLLKGQYKDKKFDMRFASEDYITPSSIQIAFGVKADLSSYPLLAAFPSRPYIIAGKEQNMVSYKNYYYEPDFAPEGCTLLITTINQTNFDYPYWSKLYENKEEYNKEKQRIGNEVKERLEEHYPELKGKITVVDVATPITYHRYTGAYKGAWMSFMMTTKTKSIAHSGRIKGLKNFYLTGQWLEPPGGLPVAATTGKFTILKICKQEKIKVNL